MEQCLFNEIIQFVLETISSESYLESLGIYRPEPLEAMPGRTGSWFDFVNSVNNQTVRPGIYPLSFGEGSVHYYAVRYDEKTGKYLIGNGYPEDEADKWYLPKDEYSVYLHYQKNHSHGLCQTYALMFYLGLEKWRLNGDFGTGPLKSGIKEGEGFNSENIEEINRMTYISNVFKGFRFLRYFVNEDYENRERCWSKTSYFKNLTKLCYRHSNNKRIEAMEKRLGKHMKNICLTDLLNIINDEGSSDNILQWYN
jgi:hypothetical protein